MPQGHAHQEGPLGGGGRRGAVRAWIAWWVLCAALWLLLIDRTQLAELLTGVVCATIAATAAVLVRQQRETILRPRPQWFRRAWRPAVALFADLWPLARALVTRGVLRRGDTGTLVELPFEAVGADPREAAFRVFTTVLGSLGPNTLIVDVDPERRVLRVHQLVATDDPARAALPLEGP
jgi:multisubunit Na+/H+ antiporter MnhE subunit